MPEVDPSKIIRIKVVPSEGNDLGLVQERACRECALGPSRKGESKTYSTREEMNYCVGCDASTKQKYERGKPFEIGILSKKVLKYQKAELQIKSEPSEEIPKAPQSLFLFKV